MSEIVVMPKLGLTMMEGLLVSWVVPVGGSIEVGEPLCEIETEKLSVDFESPAAGILLRCAEPGQTVPVGEPIAVLGAQGEDASEVALFGETTGAPPTPPAVPPAPDRAAPAAPELPSSSDSADTGRRPISPAARTRATELGVDPSGLLGTGPSGRITMADVEKAAAKKEKAPAPDPQAGREPTPLRRAIAAAMTTSAAIPQFSLERDVRVDAALQALEKATDPNRPTIADIAAVATARALRAHPEFLQSWQDGTIRTASGAHLGLAVAVSGGLVVQVVPDADRLSVPDMAATRRKLQDQAVAGHRSAGGASAAFSLSNLGSLGIDRFRALINPPESGIIALGRVAKGPDGAFMTLTISADHRVVDGVDGAKLLMTIVESIQSPEQVAQLIQASAETAPRGDSQ